MGADFRGVCRWAGVALLTLAGFALCLQVSCDCLTQAGGSFLAAAAGWPCALLLGGWPARGLPVVTAEDPEGTQKHVRPRKAESRHTIACIHTSPAQPQVQVDTLTRAIQVTERIHPRYTQDKVYQEDPGAETRPGCGRGLEGVEKWGW